MHHTEYLACLVADGKLGADTSVNGGYDAQRNVLKVLSKSVVELPHNRENSFCCGAGGAQFWKEEEPGTERISENRLREVNERLDGAADKVLAVRCPFCKSMLDSSPGRGEDAVAIRDVAKLLLEGGGGGRRRRLTAPMIEAAATAVAIAPEPEVVIAEPNSCGGCGADAEGLGSEVCCEEAGRR